MIMPLTFWKSNHYVNPKKKSKIVLSSEGSYLCYA